MEGEGRGEVIKNRDNEGSNYVSSVGLFTLSEGLKEKKVK